MNFKNLVKKKTAADYVTFSLVIAVGILIDQITKLLAVKFLKPLSTVSLLKIKECVIFGAEIPETAVLNLTYVENTGAAFGMLKNSPWVFNTVSVIAIIIMLAYLYLGHTDSRLSGISLAMLVSGGIGNMIDRFTLHYVVDFIDFRLINFAVFNGADSFVCVGAGLLVFSMIREMLKDSRAAKAAQAASDGAHGEDEE